MVCRAKDDKGPGDGDTANLDWFKVKHDGLKDGQWGVDRMIKNEGWEDFEVPKCIPNGNYLLRVEAIGESHF